MTIGLLRTLFALKGPYYLYQLVRKLIKKLINWNCTYLIVLRSPFLHHTEVKTLFLIL